jgi:hypothetical protein
MYIYVGEVIGKRETNKYGLEFVDLKKDKEVRRITWNTHTGSS